MIVGVPKEVKVHEYRVGLVPSGVKALVESGHDVLLEHKAGVGSGLSDAEFIAQGAEIVDTAEEIWKRSDLVIKVKEPQPPEIALMRHGLVLYTYLHLAPAPELTRGLLDAGVVGIAYETIQAPDRSLPLLTPMSEVAGRMSVQAGARSLEKENGGRGVLLGGVPGTAPGSVVVLGGGVVGTHAAKMAVGLGADVVMLDISLPRLRQLDDLFNGRVRTLHSNPLTIQASIERADLVIGAALVPGAKTPHLVSREMLQGMKENAVVVDVAVDQGGCFQTTHATTHEEPTYFVDGVLHYAVANMPGAVPRTSTFALTNATLPHALNLANLGWREAAAQHPDLALGVNVVEGDCVYEPIARDLDLPYRPLEFE